MSEQGHRARAAESSQSVSITQVAVVVPAADEQDRIGEFLAAVETAQAHLRDVVGRGVTVVVVVVLDGCVDGAAAAVAEFPAVRTVTIAARNVGRGRAAGSTAALKCSHLPEQVWTAHTDADSTVPAHWLSEMVCAADRGYEVVLGTVVPDAEFRPCTPATLGCRA